MTHFELARLILDFHGKLEGREERRENFELLAGRPPRDLALILLWIGALAPPATVNEFYLGMFAALGFRAGEIAESVHESEPPDDARFTR